MDQNTNMEVPRGTIIGPTLWNILYDVLYTEVTTLWLTQTIW